MGYQKNSYHLLIAGKLPVHALVEGDGQYKVTFEANTEDVIGERSILLDLVKDIAGTMGVVAFSTFFPSRVPEKRIERDLFGAKIVCEPEVTTITIAKLSLDVVCEKILAHEEGRNEQ